jgi:HAD superfamily hydrolase (TIGR01490 family)
MSSRNVAFLDIDGTLLSKPSLERRLFRQLCWQRKIPGRNYFTWFVRLFALGVKDLRTAAQRNKSYLRGIAADEIWTGAANGRRFSFVPRLFPAAVQRIWWHAMRGDRIVLVSGTLEPLAEAVKFALERELLCRGIDARVTVFATKMEIHDGRFTGSVTGEPIFGEAKARAIRRFAARYGVTLAHCSAYGDSSQDSAMLAAVGHPYAVNPTRRLRRIAAKRGGPELGWSNARTSKCGERKAIANGVTISR